MRGRGDDTGKILLMQVITAGRTVASGDDSCRLEAKTIHHKFAIATVFFNIALNWLHKNGQIFVEKARHCRKDARKTVFNAHSR